MGRKKEILILAIETSCDETAAAVILGSQNIKIAATKIRSNELYSQIRIHQRTQGVMPEVASRAQIEKILPVIKIALKKAKTKLKNIDLIAVTIGPGLIGSLLVGVDTAKTLAYLFGKPVIPINHLEAHLYANFADGKIWKTRNPKSEIRNIFPAIILIVSGGHSSLILMRGHGKYKIIGSTLDDAAGEAFDKVARILGLGYPGGPAIARAANSYKLQAKSYKLILPRPMIDAKNFDFSFSGLKTAILYQWRDFLQKQGTNAVPQLNDNRMTIESPLNHYGMTTESQLNHHRITTIFAAEFQQAVIDVLIMKTIKAARKYQAKTIMLGGGVAANQLLRRELRRKVKSELSNSHLLIPNSTLCTDNAAMIGACAYFRYLRDKKSLKSWSKVKINLNPKL